MAQNFSALNFSFVDRLTPCSAPKWARTGHLQTILGHLFKSPKLNEPGERIEIELSGGDKAVARHLKGDSRRVVYLFHGLGGSTDADYMHRTALIARRAGDTVFMFNHRGCGEGVSLAKEPYHSGRAEDLSALIREGRKLYPDHQHLAIGFSLSANALLLLVAGERKEFGAETLPDCAIAVNAPINLERASQLISSGANRIYDIRFMRQMRDAVRTRLHRDPTLRELKIPILATLHDFDELYTARSGGFKDRADYYRTCSAKQYLNKIKVPTVILTAEDDPFVDVKDYKSAEISPMAKLHIERFGGHMGYLAGQPTPYGTKRWLDYAIYEFMKGLET